MDAVAKMSIEREKMPAVHDQVLVEAEVDEKVITFRAIIVSVTSNSIWLGLTKPDEQLERLVAGDPVQLTFRRGSSAMIAGSTFLSHLGSSKARLFSIEWPNDMRMIQRRVYLRMDTDCPIEYTVVSHSAAGTAGMVGQGVTRNLSAGGLQFKEECPIEEAVAIGDELEVTLGLDKDVVRAEAEVVRVDDGTELGTDGKPKHPLRPQKPSTLVAIRFVSISAAAEDRIVRYIFALQRISRDASRRK
jgi:c-di-GMP-binding flagellar brake protein YcgR